MSRNLCTSTCCENTLRLSDLRGQPIEFRRYADSCPGIGTKWTCPDCETVYFAMWKTSVYNQIAGRFIIDLSYYESYNDEHDVCHCCGQITNLDEPRHLCTDNAEDRQEIW